MKFFEKIKNFFLRLFSSRNLLNEENVVSIQLKVDNINSVTLNSSTQYRELLELQKLYLQGKIKETDMTSEQVLALECIFDSQIENAKRKNEATKRKIYKALSEDQETMSIYEKIKSGELDGNQLTEEQVLQIEFLYDIETIEKQSAKGVV